MDLNQSQEGLTLVQWIKLLPFTLWLSKLITPAPDEAGINKRPATAIFLKNKSWAIHAASAGAAQKA